MCIIRLLARSITIILLTCLNLTQILIIMLLLSNKTVRTQYEKLRNYKILITKISLI